MNTRVGRGFALSVAIALTLSTWLGASAASSPVADAAMHGDRDAVRSLLRQGLDVNAAQGDGMTALHWAGRQGDAQLAEMLIYAGANVKATTRLGGYTPLMMAAETGNVALIDALLKAGADPKMPSSSGATPLMMAARSGRAGAVTLLIDRGADVNARESTRGEDALMFAVASNAVDCMKVLIEHGANVKATTRVVDVSAQTSPEEEAFLRAQQAGGRRGGGEPPSAGAPLGTEASAKAPAVDPVTAGYAGLTVQEAQQALAAAANGQPSPAAQQLAQFAGRTGRAGIAGVAGVSRQFRMAELVKAQGGLTPLLFAARQGYGTAALTLLDAGADVNQVSAGDKSSPLLMAIINGHYDLAKALLDRGADPNLAADNGVAPVYATVNNQWIPKSGYPQPRAQEQQRTTYLELMKALLDKGADPNARVRKKLWYDEYNFDLSGVDEIGATPFWRAAFASDPDAMKLLVSYGADPTIPTMKPAGRPRTGDATGRETIEDVSGLPPVPLGGPGVPPLLAAAGAGFGEGFAGNSHHVAPGGWMPAVRYLVEELHVDVNTRDHEGNTALHHAAARGDNEMIEYLLSKGANPRIVNREGMTTVDMANGPVQRVQPFPETIALLEKLGVKNNHRCKSC